MSNIYFKLIGAITIEIVDHFVKICKRFTCFFAGKWQVLA